MRKIKTGTDYRTTVILIAHPKPGLRIAAPAKGKTLTYKELVEGLAGDKNAANVVLEKLKNSKKRDNE